MERMLQFLFSRFCAVCGLFAGAVMAALLMQPL